MSDGFAHRIQIGVLKRDSSLCLPAQVGSKWQAADRARRICGCASSSEPSEKARQ